MAAAELALTVNENGGTPEWLRNHLWSPDEFLQMYVEVQNFSSVFNKRLPRDLPFQRAEFL